MQSQACGFEWTPLWHFVVIIIFIYLFSWFSEENIWISSCRSLLILAVLEDFHLEDAVVWLCRLKLMVICTNWCTKFWSQVVFWHLSTSLVIAICAITCWFPIDHLLLLCLEIIANHHSWFPQLSFLWNIGLLWHNRIWFPYLDFSINPKVPIAVWDS